MTNRMGLPRIFDLHVIVNKVAQDPDKRYITVVADAPVERFGMEMGSFSLESTANGQQWMIAGNSRLYLSRNATKEFVIDRSDMGSLTPEQIGEELFTLLFPPYSPARRALDQSCVKAGDNWLRLRLELHADLASLPWELIRCPLREAEAAQINGARIAVIRYFGRVDREQVSSRTEKKLTVLIIAATPHNVGSAVVVDSIRKEVEAIQEILSPTYDCQVITGHNTYGNILERVQKLREQEAQLVGVHLAGHGDVDDNGGYFCGEDKVGNCEKIYATRLQAALRDAVSLKWAVLNACWTADGPAGRSLAGLGTGLTIYNRIPTILAFQRGVHTRDAEALAEQFYRNGIVESETVEEVVWRVRLACGRGSNLIILQRSLDSAPARERISVEAASQHGTPIEAKHNDPLEHADSLASDISAQPHVEVPAKTDAQPVEFVRIPSGTFTKGFTREQVEQLLDQFRANGLPLDMDSARRELLKELAKPCDLPVFRISTTPITNEQFELFVKAKEYQTDAEEQGESVTWQSAYTKGRGQHPVVNVSFRDAEAYCRWQGGHVPTADQWEKAYRGPEGRPYPWGHEFDFSHCNTAESGFNGTTPVRKFVDGRSFYGCFDMLGNVEEWLSSNGQNGRKLIRGGSWEMSCQVFGLPTLSRLGVPTSWFRDTGFRCVRDGEL